MSNLIYIIDDNMELCELVKIALETKDYTVRFAMDGESGLKLMNKKSPDLLILDLKMPRINGFEIIQKMRSSSKLSKVPIIVLTVVTRGSRRPDEEWRKSLEVADFITKPFQPLDLLKRVDKILA